MADEARHVWDRREQESPFEFHAFRVYLESGSLRRFTDVASDLGISSTSVFLMARAHRWEERAAAYDRSISRASYDEAMVEEKRRAAKRQMRLVSKIAEIAEVECERMLARVMQGDSDQETKLADLARVIDISVKLERIVAGEATEIHDVRSRLDLSSLSDDELRDLRNMSKKAKQNAAF